MVSVAGILAAGMTLASWSGYTLDESAQNPGNLPLSETRVGVQNVVSVLEMSQAAHAAAENTWFRFPSVFSEYTYTDSRDKSPVGFTSHSRSGSVGLNFLTAGDVAMSLMGTYGMSAADTENPAAHLVNNSQSYGLTLSAAKNIDWFLMGASASYNDGYSRTRTPVGRILKIEPTGCTLSPFVGAMYVKGNLSLSTVPTYMVNWVRQDYDSTGPAGSSDDHSTQDTFVWMNTASYKVSEKVTVGAVANWNRVTHIKKQLGFPPQTISDREWVTVGPKVTVHLTPALSAYVSGTKDICSGSYDTVQGVVGLNYGF